MESGKQGRLVIGLGTGRCGTVSLSQFLGDQKNAYSIHEGLVSMLPYRHHLLPWEKNEKRYLAWKEMIVGKLKRFDWVADTGSYFLPYMEWVMRDFPNVVFICLERPRDEVIESFMKKTVGVNPWMNHKGNGYLIDQVWDEIHPKFDAPDKRAAIGIYWDMYHKEAVIRESHYPTAFKIFPTASLNSDAGRNDMLAFIGIPEEKRVILKKIHHSNKSNTGIIKIMGTVRDLAGRIIPNTIKAIRARIT